MADQPVTSLPLQRRDVVRLAAQGALFVMREGTNAGMVVKYVKGADTLGGTSLPFRGDVPSAVASGHFWLWPDQVRVATAADLLVEGP